MIRGIVLGLLILNFAGIVYADVGPAPPDPDITVYLIENGASETTITQIVYHCMGIENDSGSGAVDPQLAILPCSNGTCTNSGWYYKFNPCFSFPEGYFSYELDGVQKKTGMFTPAKEQGRYELVIDVETATVTSQTPSPGCVGAIVLLGIFGMIVRR